MKQSPGSSSVCLQCLWTSTTRLPGNAPGLQPIKCITKWTSIASVFSSSLSLQSFPFLVLLTVRFSPVCLALLLTLVLGLVLADVGLVHHNHGHLHFARGTSFLDTPSISPSSNCNTVAFYDDQPGIASVKFVLSKSTIVYVRPSVNN